MELRKLLKKIDDRKVIKVINCNKDENYEIYSGTSSVALDNLPNEILDHEILFAIGREQNVIAIYFR